MCKTTEGQTGVVEIAKHLLKVNLIDPEPKETNMEGGQDNSNKIETKVQKKAVLASQLAALKGERSQLKNLLLNFQTEFNMLQKTLLEKFITQQPTLLQEQVEQFNTVLNTTASTLSKSCEFPRYQEESKDDFSDVNDSPIITPFNRQSIEQPFQDDDFIEVDPDSPEEITRLRSNARTRSISGNLTRPRQMSIQGPGVEEEDLIRRRTLFLNSRQSFGATLRQSFLANNNSFEATKLFENFLIISPSPEEASHHIMKNPKLTSDDTFFLKPKVIFNFAEKAKLPENVLPSSLENFLAPNGLGTRVCPDIGEFMSNNIYKLDKNYKKRFISPYEPHTSDIGLSKWDGETGAVNSQNKLYAICIKKKDLLVLTHNIYKKDIETDTIYCFLTYYPLPDLFFAFLTSTLNLIRRKRKEIYCPNSFNQIDLHVLNTTLADQLVNYLRTLSDLPTPASCTILHYPFNDDHGEHLISQVYHYPKESEAYLCLAKWEALYTLSRFSLDNINLILSAMILEKPVIFFSENITLLTATINTFLSMLTPLKYIPAIISTLSYDKLVFCESPVPVILGINKDEEFFWEKQLENTDPIKVFLDSKTIFMDKRNLDLVDFPKLDFMTEHLEELHSKVNPEKSKFAVIRNLEFLQEKYLISKAFLSNSGKKNHIDLAEEIGTPDIESAIKEIFNHLRIWIENNIAKGLIQLYRGVGDVSKTDFGQKIDNMIPNQSTREFFHAFKKTQTFCSYPYCLNNKYIR